MGIGVAGLTLTMIGILASAAISGQLELDATGIIGFVIGGVILIALVVGAVRLVVAAVTTPMRMLPAPVGRFEEFAAANRLTFTPHDVGLGLGLVGTGFPEHHTRLLETFRPESGDDFAYGTLTFVASGGRRPRRWGYLTMRLDDALPHFVVRSRARRIPTFARARRVRVGPDFARRFELLAPEGSESEARDLFTPDLLRLLGGLGGPFDAEVIGDRFNAYAKPFDIRRAAVHRHVFRIMAVVRERTSR